MHASRLRTVRCSGHLGGGGVCLGVSTYGVYTSLPCGLTDRHLQKHYLSATAVADGNYVDFVNSLHIIRRHLEETV